jgi:hydroxypyruvate isomerase
VSTLYGGLPFEERLQAAAADGFDCVEFWGTEDAPHAVESIRALGLSVSLINVDPGPHVDDAGRLSDPAATRWWRSKFAETLALAAAIDCPTINLLTGGSAAGNPRRELQTMLENLDWALERVNANSITLVLEPLNRRDRPHYLLHTIDEVVVARASLGNPERLKLLFDAYHVYQEHDDLVEAFRDHAPIVGHVQLADFPGRSEPGSGQIDVGAFLEAVAGSGYDGWIGLEYESVGLASALAWTRAISIPSTSHALRVGNQIGPLTGPQRMEVK